MNKKILDKTTMQFCIDIVGQYQFLCDCKRTKKSRELSAAYEKVIETLEHYKNLKDHPNVTVIEREGN